LSKQEKQTFNVTVLTRREISVYPKVGVEEKQIRVTYIAAGLAPHTLRFKKTEHTPEKEKRAIRESIEERLKEKPEKFTV